MPDATRTLLGFDPARLKLPEKPGLEGLECKWMPRWEESGVYRFDRTRSRADVYAIDTPPPTVSGSLHVGHVFSFTHTDLVARFHRMRGRMVFYPMGWDDNGLPTERRVQNYYGVRCDPSLPYDPSFAPPQQPPKQPISISRPNFIELCARLTVEDEKAFEHLWKYLGLSVDWSMTYATIGKRAQRVSQLAFRRLLERKLAYQVEAPTLWDVDFKTADPDRAQRFYNDIARLAAPKARQKIVEQLRGSGDLVAEPRPITHAVKFYEKGDRPLEIITSRQWFIKTIEFRDALLMRGRELKWHPEYMAARYCDWVSRLNGDWCISRQRFFGVPFPVWYPISDVGRIEYERPIAARPERLPIDPSTDAPPGYRAEQRGQTGGFIGDPDVMDTWATSSVSPQIVCGWPDDADLFARTFPMDLRPQAHDIIRTWLFSTVLRPTLR